MDKIKDLNDQLTVELRNLQETYEDYKETHRLGLPKNDLLSKKFDFEYRKAHARINELLNTSGIEKQLSESKTLSRLFLGAFFPRIETVLRQEIRDRELLLSSMRANSKTLKFQSQNRTTDIPGALAIAFGRGLHSEGSRPRKKDTPRRKKAHFFDNATDRMELYKFMNRSFLEENPKAIEVIDSRLAETVDSSLSKLARRLVLLRDEFWNKCNLRKDHEFSMKFKANIEHSRKHVVNLANFAKTHPDHIFYMHKRINQTFLCFFNMQATLANLNNAEQRRCVSIMRDQLARDENKITKLAEKFCDFETKVVVDRNFSGRYWRDQFSKRRRTETAKVDENGEISDEDCEVEDATDDERSDEDNLDAQDDAKLTAEKMCQETDADVDALTALSGDEWDSPTSVADISEANHSKVQQMVEEVLEKKDIDFQEAQQELIRLGLECKAVKADELRAGENIGSGSFSIVRLTTIQSSIKRVAVKLVKPTARLPFSVRSSKYAVLCLT
ncbi:hypothetical protein BD410DRAFT_273866 [Rickenella mellea]|uniref:Protein kinase domain-containing protein n=1 Tax=Rickenella mellea TaxID=50990 RepID=A0A4Y7PFP1_9AGAM|nr:hypothetical protein BD410DRAFT_273866 [Rickenella mellea]